MESVRLNLLLEILAQGIGQQIYEKDYYNQNQRRAISNGQLRVEVGATRGNDIQMVGQSHALVEDTAGELRQEIGGAGEENGRRLARHAPQGQDKPGNDVGHTHGQNDMPDGLELCRPQGPAALAHTVRNGLQRLFRSTDDQRQAEQPQSERAGQDAVAKTQVIDKQGHAEQTENDGGDAAQVVGHHADEAHNPPLRCIFIHVDTAHHAHGEGEKRTAHHQIERADNGRPDAARGHAVRRGCKNEVPTDNSHTFI